MLHFGQTFGERRMVHIRCKRITIGDYFSNYLNL